VPRVESDPIHSKYFERHHQRASHYLKKIARLHSILQKDTKATKTMMSPTIYFLFGFDLIVISSSNAFTTMPTTTAASSKLFMADGASEEVKAAPMVSGEQLEMMLQEWDTPIVIDAYATWCVSYRSLTVLHGTVDRRYVQLETERPPGRTNAAASQLHRSLNRGQLPTIEWKTRSR
jgi:hypothetical protein